MLRCSNHVKRGCIATFSLCLLAVVATGCSTFDSEEPPLPVAENDEYPNLASVPDRPDVTSLEDQRAIEQGLRADRRNARYSEAPLAETTAAGTTPPPPSPAPAAAASSPVPAFLSGSNTAPAPASAPAPQATVAQPAPSPRPITSEPVIPANPPPAAPVAVAAAPTAAPTPVAAPANRVATAAPASTSSVIVNPVTYGAAGTAATTGAVPATVIYFAHGSSSLNGTDLARIRQVAQVFRQQGGSVRVVGHASLRTGDMDPVSRQSANLEISWQRAQAVADALRRQGVPGERVTTTAVSDSQPLYFEVMPSGEAGNRRVEIYLE